MQPERWYSRASDLLRGDDPGPTPFLVDELLVDRAVAAIVGAPKLGKTWVVLELAIAIATGRSAFGRFQVRKPGPVLLVLEESGEAALHRRLDALTRGQALEADELQTLYYAANKRVRLNEPDWQRRLDEACAEIKPRAVFLDPLARLKGATDENVQKEIAPVLDYMRDLRDSAGTFVGFVQHVGHGGDRMRGSSDFEAYWESKLTLRTDNGSHYLTADHREAESTGKLPIRFEWHHDTRSLRIVVADEKLERLDTAEQVVTAYLLAHPGASQTDTEKIDGIAAKMARQTLARMETAGRAIRAPAEKLDGRGRTVRYQGYFLPSQAALSPGTLTLPDDAGAPANGAAPATRPASLEADGAPEHDAGPSNGGDLHEFAPLEDFIPDGVDVDDFDPKALEGAA